MKTCNRWLILAACIIINLCLGAGYAWSVFQGPLVELFGFSAAKATLAFSISFGMGPVGMILFGPILDKRGPRLITFLGGLLFGLGFIMTSFMKSLGWLYLSYGLISGLGIGMAYGATIATTVTLFPDKRGLASGLNAAGFGSGAIVFAPVAANLIQLYGVLSAFRILGIAILIIICTCSLILSVPKKEGGERRVSERDKRPSEMLRTASFWVLWFIYIMGSISGMMIIGHASPISQDHLGFTLALATAIVSIVSLSNTLGRILWGSISDRFDRYAVVSMMFGVSTIGLLIMFAHIHPYFSVVGVILIALCYGGFLGIFPGITVENFGEAFNGTNYGFMFTACGIAAAVGPVLAASVKEANNGDYSMAFLVAAGLNIIGLALMMIFRKKAQKNA